MRTLPSLVLVASLAAACTAHRAPATESPASTAAHGDTRYVVGLLPLRPTTPEAAVEAKAQDALLASALATLTRDMHFEVAHPALQAPTRPELAPALVQAAKVDALVWGDVSLENGKLSVKLAGFERTVDAPFGTWPMRDSRSA